MATWLKEPAASRKTLVLTAGLVWVLVGVILGGVALVWLSAYDAEYYLLIAGGLMIGLVISRLGFSRVQTRNVSRIRALSPHKGKICIFAFQALQSYFLVLVMMALGYALRSLPIPHVFLAGIYLIIGTALLRSGLDYIKASRSF